MSFELLLDDRAALPTGFNADVTGLTNGTEVELYFSPVDNPYPDAEWNYLGTFNAGEGGATFYLDPRLYFILAKANGEFILPRFFQVTDGLEAIATRCRKAVVALLKFLNLPGIGERVYDQLYPDPTEISYPAVIVHEMNQQEAQEAGVNAFDSIGYGHNCQVVDDHQMTDQSRAAQFEFWREKIARALREQHLPGVPESIRSTVEYMNKAPMQNDGVYERYIGSLVIRNYVRDIRGLGA